MAMNNDNFARIIGGAVKIAHPDATVNTYSGFGHVTLNGQMFRFTVEEVTLNFGQCDYDREGVGRCPNTATHLYYRDNERTVTCDHHKMGDGKEGRKDWGWKEIEVIQCGECGYRHPPKSTAD